MLMPLGFKLRITHLYSARFTIILSLTNINEPYNQLNKFPTHMLKDVRKLLTFL